MLFRLLLFISLIFLFVRSVYYWGWASTWQRLRLGWGLFLQEAQSQWQKARQQASSHSMEAISLRLPAFVFSWQRFRFLWVLRYWISGLRRVYLQKFLALPLVARALRLSQAYFFSWAWPALCSLVAIKYLFFETPLLVCFVHLFFGSNVLYWLYRGYHGAEAKERVLYLNLAFCYFYCLILLLFFYPSGYLFMAAHFPRRRVP